MHLDWINLRHRIEYALFCCAAGLVRASGLDFLNSQRQDVAARRPLPAAAPAGARASEARLSRRRRPNAGESAANVGQSRPHLRRILPSAAIRRKRAHHHRGEVLLARTLVPTGAVVCALIWATGNSLSAGPALRPPADPRLPEAHQPLGRPVAGLCGRPSIPAASCRNIVRRRSSLELCPRRWYHAFLADLRERNGVKVPFFAMSDLRPLSGAGRSRADLPL